MLLLPASIAVEWLGAPGGLYTPAKILGGLALGLWVINLVVLLPLNLLTSELAASQKIRQRESRDPLRGERKARRFQAYFYKEEFGFSRGLIAFLCGLALSMIGYPEPILTSILLWGPPLLLGIAFFISHDYSPIKTFFRLLGYLVFLAQGAIVGFFLPH